jgi:lysophospholipase L1-like esterase
VLLKEYCREQGLTFIDLNKVLAPSGILEAKYSLDQLHLTAEGYSLWQAEIRPYLN